MLVVWLFKGTDTAWYVRRMASVMKNEIAPGNPLKLTVPLVRHAIDAGAALKCFA